MNLHLGCGPIKLPGFVNIDKELHWEPDRCIDYLDLYREFDKGTAENVFSCHSIEHLAYPDEVKVFFWQANRVLKPGGILRVVVPDLRKVATAYVNGSDLKEIYGGEFYYYKDCPAERFLYFMREWEHKIVFDEQLLRMFFEEAGFTHVRVMPFGVSDTPELRGIDRFESESLVMEGTK